MIAFFLMKIFSLLTCFIVPVDKVKNRLEQLDQNEDDAKQTLQVTQKDYVAHIENLHSV